jgi:amino acid transporter
MASCLQLVGMLHYIKLVYYLLFKHGALTNKTKSEYSLDNEDCIAMHINQEAATQEVHQSSQEDEKGHRGSQLGPLLCWAVVFADIGTSVYYTPGILYGTVGKLAGFFVFLTMAVFVLLTLKYAEVSHRYPQGGGVVTVAAQAINHWVGALGGMFILVDYFLTAAISCLSGILYFSVVVPAIGPYAVWITVVVLILLGVLNWVGISESAKVSFVGAIIAFASDIAILFTVFTHISFSQFLSLFPSMFAGRTVTPVLLLTGFAGAFLAFSGLESISQLSPVMKIPRKRTAGIALLIVVLTIGITSPLLTMLSTLLQPDKAANSVYSAQLVSLLGGHFGSTILQTEVAISASALLVFASNTAIIGSYHVFMALSRMEFFPAFVLRRNQLRGTPHYSIALSTAIPIIVLIVVNGNINTLGDMYAFGLLGAFSLTCLGLDIVRYRERKLVKSRAANAASGNDQNGRPIPPERLIGDISVPAHGQAALNGNASGVSTASSTAMSQAAPPSLWKRLWRNIDFWLGVLTTLLVVTAWSTNLVSKPLATFFGGGVAGFGMLIAYINYRLHKRSGRVPVMLTGVEGQLPGSVLAVLTASNGQNDAVIRAAISNAEGHPVVFLYLGNPDEGVRRTPTIFEMVDPYLEDTQAKDYFGRAEALAQKAKIPRRFVYRHQNPETIARIWQAVHPRDTVLAASTTKEWENINPDRIRYELTPQGKVVHMLKNW